MIFTIANGEQTDKLFAERAGTGQRVFKEGLSSRSRGGPVWATVAEAQAWLTAEREQVRFKYQRMSTVDLAVEGGGLGRALAELEKLAVYGVEADWDKDCMDFEGEQFRRLIVTRPMVQL